MDIRILLMLTVIGIILVTLGLLGLYIDVTRRLNAVKRSLRNTDRLALANSRRLDVIEQRDRDQAEHVYFCTDNECDEARDIKYGGEGI